MLSLNTVLLLFTFALRLSFEETSLETDDHFSKSNGCICLLEGQFHNRHVYGIGLFFNSAQFNWLPWNDLLPLVIGSWWLAILESMEVVYFCVNIMDEVYFNASVNKVYGLFGSG